MKVKKPQIIKSKLKLERYTMEDFWQSCPHDVDEVMSKDRHTHLRAWRQVGMVWARLTGLSLSKAGDMFGGKNHATVLHAENLILDVLDGFGDPYIREILDEIEMHTIRFMPNDEDINVNEASCIVMLDHIVGSRVAADEAAKAEYEKYIKNR